MRSEAHKRACEPASLARLMLKASRGGLRPRPPRLQLRAYSIYINLDLLVVKLVKDRDGPNQKSLGGGRGTRYATNLSLELPPRDLIKRAANGGTPVQTPLWNKYS